MAANERARGVIPRFTAIEIQALRVFLAGLADEGYLSDGDVGSVADVPKGTMIVIRGVLGKLEKVQP
jgi:hypothetical protein